MTTATQVGGIAQRPAISRKLSNKGITVATIESGLESILGREVGRVGMSRYNGLPPPIHGDTGTVLTTTATPRKVE